MWALAITIFAMGIGAILKSNGIAQGNGLVAAGTIALPLFVFWCYVNTIYQHKDPHPQETVVAHQETSPIEATAYNEKAPSGGQELLMLQMVLSTQRWRPLTDRNCTSSLKPF